MNFQEWWDDQVRNRKQPDDHAYMLMAKAGWMAAEERMRFCGYIETGYGNSPADVGSICKVGGGKYLVPVYKFKGANQ
jgi:hypothetical protein